MKELVLAKLQIKGTDQLVFQRRDGEATISPHRLSFFGSEFKRRDIAFKWIMASSLAEQTSLMVRGLIPNSCETIEVPAQKSSFREDTLVSLFKIPISPFLLPFEVHEGTGAERYTTEEVLERNDLAATTRFVIEHSITQ